MFFPIREDQTPQYRVAKYHQRQHKQDQHAIAVEPHKVKILSLTTLLSKYFKILSR